MRGKFGESGELWFEMELIASSKLIIPIDAWLDTGFTGWLAMNDQDTQSLEWEFIGEREMITARGEAIFNAYTGIIRFGNERFEIPVLGGDDIPEVLLGLAWLQTQRLVVDFPAKLLTLGE